MHSMTGFGAGNADLSEGRIHVELRSLNHKHQDVRIRLPQELSEHGFFLEQTARARLGRGRYDISVRVEGKRNLPVDLDEGRLRTMYRTLEKLRDELAPGTELPLSGLLALPDLLKSSQDDGEDTRRALQEAFDKARRALLSMRAKEGEILLEDLKARVSRLRELTDSLTQSAEELVAHGRERLKQRLAALLEGQSTRLHDERLEQEIALLADKSDITEELVRLGSHFSQFEGFLSDSQPVGRRLDFLLQEISREVNTIGSKSQYAKTAHLVVEMKSEVERLREQVQNVD